jgi:hypothetical protein
MADITACHFVASLWGLALLSGLRAGIVLRRFCHQVPELRHDQDLLAFKKMAARQMYGALLLIALNISAIAVAFCSLYLEILSLPELIVLASGYCIPSLLLGLWVRDLEVRVQNTPAIDAQLYDARNQIVKTWKFRALPNW